MAGVARSSDDLEGNVQEQVLLLLEAANRFDTAVGSSVEHYNMAVRVRVMVHDTASSTSVFSQLGIRDNLFYVDTAGDFIPENAVNSDSRLTMMRFRFDLRDAIWVPRFNDFTPRRPVAYQVARLARGQQVPRGGSRGRTFDQWWNQPVIRDNESHTFTRRDLILYVANKAGGAHIDPEVPAKYHDLDRMNSMAWNYQSDDGDEHPLASPIAPSVRQITWELHLMLAEQRPDLMPPGNAFSRPPDVFPDPPHPASADRRHDR